MPLVYESVTAKLETGAVDTTDVTGIPGGTDQFYTVGIVLYTSNGTPGTSDVDTLSGGGLTWARVAGSTACSGRLSQPRGELWWAFGSPSSFTLTVDLLDVVRAAAGMHVTVSRISGAGDNAPINVDYSNLNGDSGGPSCTGGSDDATADLDMTVTDSDSMVFNLGYPRNDTYDTIDADYTQQYFASHNDGGDSSSQLIATRIGGGGPTDSINHVIGSAKPWFMIGCEIQVGSVTHTASGAPEITKPTATGVARRIVTATGTPSIEKPTAAGSAIRKITATGAPEITKPVAAGSAIRKITATGTPEITKPTAAGSAIRKITATGTPEITKPTANGTARRIVKASGSPSIKKPTAQGQGNTALIIPPGTDARRFREEQYRKRYEMDDDETLAIVIAATMAILDE